MKYKKIKIPIVSLFILSIFMANLFSVSFAQTIEKPINFETQLTDVALLSNYYDSVSRKFDKISASKQNFSQTSIDIADQLYKANDEVIKTGIKNFSKIDWNKYPKLKEFLKNSDKASQSGGVQLNSLKSSSNVLSTSIISTNSMMSTSSSSTGGFDWISLLIRFGKEAAVRFVCGYFGNPQPTISQYALTWRNVSDPSATLRSWGYHETNSLYGSGWTRAQTWSPWACGNNTFRDYAWIIDNHTLKEKNYSGWNPRGEPNPEINTLKSMPYFEWPLYVAWWQSNHQG